MAFRSSVYNPGLLDDSCLVEGRVTLNSSQVSQRSEVLVAALHRSKWLLRLRVVADLRLDQWHILALFDAFLDIHYNLAIHAVLVMRQMDGICGRINFDNNVFLV